MAFFCLFLYGIVMEVKNLDRQGDLKGRLQQWIFILRYEYSLFFVICYLTLGDFVYRVESGR